MATKQESAIRDSRELRFKLLVVNEKQNSHYEYLMFLQKYV